MTTALAVFSLATALEEAVQTCSKERHDVEEDGGIILCKDDMYIFFPIRNSNTGTPIAPVLYSADRDVYAKTILPMFKDGWRQYASFHTHPQFTPYPSHIDMTQLFKGFLTNYIYSGVYDKLMRYEWYNPHDFTEGMQITEIEQ